jgi:hypothetical protein
MINTRIGDLLDGLTPRYDDRGGDWERVAVDAGRGRVRPARLALVAAAVAFAVVFALAWPFRAQQGPLLERALAAVGDGPIVHVVLRGDWGGTLVDLRSGERTPVYGENEYWWNSEHPRIHFISRLGGVVQYDDLSIPREPPAEIVALGRDYRKALEDGTARVADEGSIDGEPVAWVTIRSRLLPDVADGKDHEWAQQVAVSRRTFKVVALREARDGEPIPISRERVLEAEFLPKGSGNFARPAQPSLEGRGFSQGRRPLPLEQASSLLGREPLWLGREYHGLALAQVLRETTQSGKRPEIRVTGPRAAAAIECNKLRAPAARTCFRSHGFREVIVRPDGVFVSGRFVWDDEQNDVVLFYGTLGDDKSTFRKDSIPLYDLPNVTLTEGTRASRFRRIVGSYVPPAGTVFIAVGGTKGVLHVGGLHVTIDASGEQGILAAARALKAMPD